jgi:DNA-binding response OmpR family regulator
MDVTEKIYEILIVDDVPENLQLLAAILYGENYKVNFSSSGKRALQLISAKLPDLILLDISMPEMDGYEVCTKLKSNPDTKDIPVIFLTALANSENIIKGLQFGGVDYVTKPFNTDELLARVKTHLELKTKREQVEHYAKILSEKTQEQLLLNSILNQQKIIIQQKNKDLTDSIEYATVIQNSLLPSRLKIKGLFPNNFIIFKPKDIVSGDFYYFHKVDNKVVVVVADCTGHGVPGAFVAVLGITLLNQIIAHDKITDPSTILYSLDKEFTNMVTSNNPVEKNRDGIDVAICTFNLDNSTIDFCGAKRPLYIRRKNDVLHYKGNMYSIAGYFTDKEKNFTTIKIEVNHGDCIYMCTDGYSDQFGGERSKKFSTKRFLELLQLCPENFNEHGRIIEETFDSWIGNKEQIDDVLVIGLKYF